uniref:Uncharacterized protein n=1 Tax=Anguilla anguilla TaxID=7936 RepID=A0A0E9WFS8_ANGAN
MFVTGITGVTNSVIFWHFHNFFYSFSAFWIFRQFWMVTMNLNAAYRVICIGRSILNAGRNNA